MLPLYLIRSEPNAYGEAGEVERMSLHYSLQTIDQKRKEENGKITTRWKVTIGLDSMIYQRNKQLIEAQSTRFEYDGVLFKAERIIPSSDFDGNLRRVTINLVAE